MISVVLGLIGPSDPGCYGPGQAKKILRVPCIEEFGFCLEGAVAEQSVVNCAAGERNSGRLLDGLEIITVIQ